MEITFIVKRSRIAKVPGQPQFRCKADALTITERGTWIAVARCALSLRMVVAKSRLVAGDSYPNADWLAKPVLNFVVILKFDALAFQVKMFSRAAVHQYRTVINHMAGNLHLSVQKF